MDVTQIIEGMGEEHLNTLFATHPSIQINLNLFGSLLSGEEATQRLICGTLESSYPQVFLEEESAEYLSRFQDSQITCDALVARLPDSHASGAASKQKPSSYRAYLASLPAPKPRAPPPKKISKPADPIKLAAAQARVLAQQHEMRQKAAAEKAAAAAALLAKAKTKKAPIPPKPIQKKKANTAPDAAVDPETKETKAKTLATKIDKAPAGVLKKNPAAKKRVSKLEKLRPKPLTVAPPTGAASKVQKPPSDPLPSKPLVVSVPKTVEKKEEKTTFKGAVVKAPKTPTINEMCKSLLTLI